MNQTNNAIERAYQLAEECGDIEAIRIRLKREGFSNVGAHLSGGQIRAALRMIILEKAAAPQAD